MVRTWRTKVVRMIGTRSQAGVLLDRDSRGPPR